MGKKNFDDVRTTRSVASAFDASFDDEPEINQNSETNSKSNDGNKDEKSHRINLALTDDNYMFIWMMAKRKKMTVTKFINSVFADLRLQMEQSDPDMMRLVKMLFSDTTDK